MTQGTGNNNVFPAFNGFFVQSLGLQGPPGSCGGAVAATSIDYGPATSCVPASIQDVDAMLAWIETNVICLLDPASIMAAPDGNILVWDATAGMLVPRTIGAALGSGLPGGNNNDVLFYNTASSSYVPGSLLDFLTTNLPGLLPAAFQATYPCNTPGQILTCTANGWAATSFAQAFNTGLPGTNNFDLVFWNAGTSSWQTTDAGSVIGNNLPAALAAAYPCTTGDLITCVGGQWQATTFQAAMTSGLPGTTASDILVWNGAQWVPQEEQTWLSTVLGPGLGGQSLTALGDTPASLGSPGQVLTTNPAATGTIWATPAATVTTFTGLTDTPATLTPDTFLQVNATGTGFDSVNICTAIADCSASNLQDFPALGGPLQILRVNPLGTAHEYTDLCTAISACSITSLSDGPPTLGTPNQFLKMNPAGTELVFVDFCTELANCSITNLSDGPAALGAPDQFLKMNPAGTDLIFSDFCAELANCSLTALSDTPATLGTAGQVFTMNPAGTAPIWADAANALPTGNTQDLLYYAAPGNTASVATLIEYLDLYHPAPGPCPVQLLNDGTGWAVATGVPAPPALWAFPLAPQSVGLELEVNPATLCPEWVAPSHVEGTFAIPGDFPSLQDFVDWSTGRSVNVRLALAGAQPAGVSITMDNTPSGHITIIGNAQTIGLINHASPSVDLRVEGAAHESIALNLGANAFLVNPVSLTNTSGNGVLAVNGSSFIVEGDLDVLGVGDYGLLIQDESFAKVTGLLTVATANTTANVEVSSNSTLVTEGGAQVSNSAGNGMILSGNSLFRSATDVNDTSFNQNAVHGIFAVNNSHLQVTGGGNFEANQNGGNGITLNASNLTLLNALSTIDGNTQNGVNVRTGGTASLQGAIDITNNTNLGLGLAIESSVEFGGGGPVNLSNNQIGLQLTTSAVEFSPAIPLITVTGNNVGVNAAAGGHIVAFGGNFTPAGNVTDTNIPPNVLSADGSFIQV